PPAAAARVRYNAPAFHATTDDIELTRPDSREPVSPEATTPWPTPARPPGRGPHSFSSPRSRPLVATPPPHRTGRRRSGSRTPSTPSSSRDRRASPRRRRPAPSGGSTARRRARPPRPPDAGPPPLRAHSPRPAGGRRAPA